MLAPSNCPACHQPLLHEAIPTVGLPFWRKSCQKYLSHHIVLKTKQGQDEIVCQLTVVLAPNKLFTWFPEASMCWSSKTWDLERCVWVPYFEPDFSDYNKLVNKIKTYLLFS